MVVLGQTKLQSSRPVRMTVGNDVSKQRMKFYWNKQCPQRTEESHSRPNCFKEQPQFNSVAQQTASPWPTGRWGCCSCPRTTDIPCPQLSHTFLLPLIFIVCWMLYLRSLTISSMIRLTLAKCSCLLYPNEKWEPLLPTSEPNKQSPGS